ncbi:hypothetical protein FRB96_006784 [Tulasnella sp. 330]|nr:hypothetical protein FRB96_006784 [Tulasnella sp. 330]KAG8877691.1 hypothetical protein FRB97_003182 [Tulasnella sp. 331]KAG8879771.1 hypothetical protein FRB98_005536 [Tulasnella sp. 332]
MALDTYLFVGTDVTALVTQSIGGGMAAFATTSSRSQTGAHIMVRGIALHSPVNFDNLVAISVYALTLVEYSWRVFKERPLRARQETSEARQLTRIRFSARTVVITVCMLSSLEFFWRVLKERPLRARRQGMSMASRAGDASPGYFDSKTGGTGLDRSAPNVKDMVKGLIITTILIYIRSIYHTIELLYGWGGPIISNQELLGLLNGVPVFLAMVTLIVFHSGGLISAGGPKASQPRINNL